MKMARLFIKAPNPYELYHPIFVFLITNKLTSGILLIMLENFYELSKTL